MSHCIQTGRKLDLPLLLLAYLHPDSGSEESAHPKDFALVQIKVSLRMVVLELLCDGLTPQ